MPLVCDKPDRSTSFLRDDTKISQKCMGQLMLARTFTLFARSFSVPQLLLSAKKFYFISFSVHNYKAVTCLYEGENAGFNYGNGKKNCKVFWFRATSSMRFGF